MKAWIRFITIVISGLFFTTITLAGEYDMPPVGDDIVGQNLYLDLLRVTHHN